MIKSPKFVMESEGYNLIKQTVIISKRILSSYSSKFSKKKYKQNQIFIMFRVIIGDKGYDSEENHVIAKKHGLLAIIPVRNDDIPIYRTKGENRKRMKRFARRVQKEVNS